MHSKIPGFLPLAFASLFNSVMVDAAEINNVADPELKACIVRNMPEQTMTQKLTFVVYEGKDEISSTSADLFWKREADGNSKVVVRVTAPHDRAGIAVLALEKTGAQPEFHVFLPETKRERRVAGRTIDASMFGTDFSYDDFSHLQGIATGGGVKRLDNEKIDGADNLVIELQPGSEGSKYSRILTYVDKARCALTKMSFFAKNGTPLKELTVPREEVKALGDRWIPFTVVLNDHKGGRRTVLKVNDIKYDPDIKDILFSPMHFAAGQ